MNELKQNYREEASRLKKEIKSLERCRLTLADAAEKEEARRQISALHTAYADVLKKLREIADEERWNTCIAREFAGTEVHD